MNSLAQEDSELVACEAYLESLQAHGVEAFKIIDKPDLRIRQRKAPDWIARSADGKSKIAIEVSALQSSGNAGYDAAVWEETFGSLKDELRQVLKENLWFFFPSVSAATPGLETRAARERIKQVLCEHLPAEAKKVDVFDEVVDCLIPGVPFAIGIRRRRLEGSVKTSRLVDVPTSQNIAEIASYLSAKLPGKLRKFDAPEWDAFRRVVLLDNRVSFIEGELVQAALTQFASGRSDLFRRVDEIHLIRCGTAVMLQFLGQ